MHYCFVLQDCAVLRLAYTDTRLIEPDDARHDQESLSSKSGAFGAFPDQSPNDLDHVVNAFSLCLLRRSWSDPGRCARGGVDWPHLIIVVHQHLVDGIRSFRLAFTSPETRLPSCHYE